MQDLTQESTQKAREWFSNNCLAMATKAEESILTGVFYCNDPQLNAIKWRQEAQNWLDGKHKTSFTFWQKAYYIQTGECPALLPS